jgi:hypothetical protein
MTDWYLTTREVPEWLAVSEDHVRAHAAELGGVRIGGSRSPLRFDPDRVEAWLDARRLQPPRTGRARRPGPPRSGGLRLLPIPDDAPARRSRTAP